MTKKEVSGSHQKDIFGIAYSFTTNRVSAGTCRFVSATGGGLLDGVALPRRAHRGVYIAKLSENRKSTDHGWRRNLTQKGTEAQGPDMVKELNRLGILKAMVRTSAGPVSPGISVRSIPETIRCSIVTSTKKWTVRIDEKDLDGSCWTRA